jgi:Mg2+-importing ATPase
MSTLMIRPRAGHGVRGASDRRRSEELLAASAGGADQVLHLLDTSAEGLTEEEAARRRQRHSPNEVAHERTPPWYRLLLGNFTNPFIVLLLTLGVVSWLTDDTKAVVVVSVMIAVSVLMRFLQEYRSCRAAEQLRAMVRTTATVLRRQQRLTPDGAAVLAQKREVPFADLVPGDVIRLSAGDMVPADVRLLHSKDLFVSQSGLTGESMPVEKYDTPAVVDGNGRVRGNPLEADNLCFLGTAVVSGSATAAVVATGSDTCFGALARSVLGRRSMTSFDKGVNSVSWLLIRFILVMVPLIFFLNGLVRHDWHEAFLFALAVAVGLTPEMLPMVVTANLAKGAVSMARRKVIVKRLNAIQNLGAMDVLCTDKTGTLTQDRVVLEMHLDPHFQEDVQVLHYAYLNSYYQTGLKSLLDRAVLEHVEVEHALHVPQAYEKVDEIPFDFGRRRMSVVVRDGRGEHLLISKGAVEEMLGVCSRVAEAGGSAPLTEALRRHVRFMMEELNADGLRVIAVASRVMGAEDRPYTVADESDLVLAGFVAFLDPPKETAAAALAALADSGVRVKVLTGDSEVVARKVCKDVDLAVADVALGAEVERCSDEELQALAERTTLFARLSPMHKARVIWALQHNGHTVGFLGDGINDAPALRDADVGLSVDTAADVVRESADVILTEKSLLVLADGVLKGRQVYGNIIKYIKMTASSNFGNVLSMVLASSVLPFLPLLPIQILIQNLLYDCSQLSLPWDRMDREFLVRPRKWDPSGIGRFMINIGPISSLFDVLTFALLWFVFGARSEAAAALFHSGWFVEGLLSQTMIVHLIRTQKVPFLQSTAAAPVLLLTGLVMAVGLWLPFSPHAAVLGLEPLPWSFFPWLTGILLGYGALTQAVKAWYVRKFHGWL